MSKVISHGESLLFELYAGKGTGLKDRLGNEIKEGDLVLCNNMDDPMRLQVRLACFSRSGVGWALALPGTDDLITGLPEDVSANAEYGVDIIRERIETTA